MTDTAIPGLQWTEGAFCSSLTAAFDLNARANSRVLKIELMQSHMKQKAVLRVEVDARELRV